jgi:hypothetical protein
VKRKLASLGFTFAALAFTAVFPRVAICLAVVGLIWWGIHEWMFYGR